jgi:YVTN family beta-propeller protein
MPFAAALDRFRNWLYVANAGSNDVTIVDLNTGLLRANIPVGANPRGIVLNRDNTFAFVNNALDGTVTIINTNALEVVDILPVSNLTVPVDILIGAQLFHSAADPRLSADRWLSCANCHFDGLPDGRTWAGFPGGPRNTPPLFNLVETAPYNWDESWDELADVEVKIRRLQGGTGLIEAFPPGLAAPLETAHAGLSPDLDTLAAYLANLPTPSNPSQADPAQIARGGEVFSEQGCAECHIGAAGSSPATYDVGTGGVFDTPQLRYLWLSAPYFHDGAAATLHQVFSLPGTHFLSLTVAPADIDALVAYLLSR